MTTLGRRFLKRTARAHGHYSGPSGYHRRKGERSRVVAWDGEGFQQRDGSQRYGLVMNSRGAESIDTSGLHTLDLMGFLTREAARLGKWVYHVGFGISYDANMMLGDVPRTKVARIAAGEPTKLGGQFVVRYIPAKSLWVKDQRTSSSFMLYDTYGFHQVGFVRAAEKMLGAADRRLNIVRTGKAKRGAFEARDLADVKRYTAMELEITVEMTERILAACRAVGFHLSRLDGAGAIAAAMLRKYGVRQFMAAMPDEIHRGSTYAYAGGRTEMPRCGYSLDGGWRADMRSAYPTEQVDLPCLAHGAWKRRRDGDFREPFALAEIRWDFDRYGFDEGWLMPFPLRTPSGSIYFPVTGHTWVWRPELDAARRVKRFRDDPHHLKVVDGWEWVPACAHRPFGWMPEVYQERKERRARGDFTEYPLKLGMNSSYGKTAQHVGGSPDRPPPFHQLEWAGFITSGTRARLFTAALRCGRRSVVALMTDGMLTTSDPRDHLDARVGENLGEWELTEWDRLVSAQSGVYFFTDGPFLRSCPKCGTTTNETPMRGWRCPKPTCRASNYTAHFRGFNPNALDPDDILAAWARLETQIPTTIRKFWTMKECLRSDGLWAKWRTWEENDERVLDAHATGKRSDVVPPSEWTDAVNPSMKLMDTMPADPFVVDSWPYVLPWDAVLRDADSEDVVGDKEQVSIE